MKVMSHRKNALPLVAGAHIFLEGVNITQREIMQIQLYNKLLSVINESHTSMNKDRLAVFAFMLTNKFKHFDGEFTLCINEEIKKYFHNDSIALKKVFMDADVLVKVRRVYDGPLYYTLKNVEDEIVEVTIKSKTAKNAYRKHNSLVFGKPIPFKFDKKAKHTTIKKIEKKVLTPIVPTVVKDELSGSYHFSDNEDVDFLENALEVVKDIGNDIIEDVPPNKPVKVNKWDAFDETVRMMNGDFSDEDIDVLMKEMV